MIYLQPITFYAILRHLPDQHNTEIAEHPDGAIKAYAEQWQANQALTLMDGEGWHVDELLMVPPAMTAANERAGIAREIQQLNTTMFPARNPKVGTSRQKKRSLPR